MQAWLANLGPPELLALAGALGWASGFRLYAVLFLAGASGYMGWVDLPPGLAVLQHPAALGVSVLLAFTEFFADKIPLVDSLWDAVHTVIRIPAGAALVAGALGGDAGVSTWVAALLGGSLAATAHATKMTARAAVNTSPEPFSNAALSMFEDGLVVGVFWLAATHPFAFGIALLVALIVMALLLVVLVKFLGAAVRTVSRFFSGAQGARQGS